METVLLYLQIFAWFYIIGWIVVCSAVIYGLIYLLKKMLRRNKSNVV